MQKELRYIHNKCLHFRPVFPGRIRGLQLKSPRRDSYCKISIEGRSVALREPSPQKQCGAWPERCERETPTCYFYTPSPLPLQDFYKLVGRNNCQFPIYLGLRIRTYIKYNYLNCKYDASPTSLNISRQYMHLRCSIFKSPV